MSAQVAIKSGSGLTTAASRGQTGVVVMSTCDGYIASSGSDRWNRPCPNSAVEVITAGCVHEHIGERDLCTMHADDARSGIMLCGDCLDTKRVPHRCFLRVLAAKRCSR